MTSVQCRRKGKGGGRNRGPFLDKKTLLLMAGKKNERSREEKKKKGDDQRNITRVTFANEADTETTCFKRLAEATGKKFRPRGAKKKKKKGRKKEDVGGREKPHLHYLRVLEEEKKGSSFLRSNRRQKGIGTDKRSRVVLET